MWQCGVLVSGGDRNEACGVIGPECDGGHADQAGHLPRPTHTGAPPPPLPLLSLPTEAVSLSAVC